MIRFVFAAFTACSFAILSMLFGSGPVLAQENGFIGPNAESEVHGQIDVRGIAAHPTFRKWQLDLLLNGDAEEATFLAVSEEPALADQPLTSLDTTRYPDGEHLLRLRVVHSNLNYDEYLLPFVVDNDRGASRSPISAISPWAGESADQESTSDRSPVIDRVESLPVATNLTGTGDRNPSVTPRRTTNNHTLATRLDIPFDKDGRWIEVDLAEQTLRAWDADQLFMQTRISSGADATPTVQGVFSVNRKVPSQRMVGRDYDLADVKSVMYFFSNYAIHGAYWHGDFGERVSHGCVNMRENEAEALFEWATVGTPVFVYE